MGNRALAKTKGGEEDLGQGVLLSRGTCVCRSGAARRSTACSGNYKDMMAIAHHITSYYIILQSEQELL